MNEMRRLMEAASALNETGEDWIDLSKIFPYVRHIPVSKRANMEDLYRALDILGIPRDPEEVSEDLLYWSNDQYGITKYTSFIGHYVGYVYHIGAQDLQGIREIRKALASTGFIKR